jgi:hypothetical protein
MPVALAIFAVFITVGSAFAVMFPSDILSFAAEFLAEPGGVWWAAAMRLLLAALMWFSAPVSRTPVTFRVLAGVALLAAVSLPIMGTERMLTILEWYASQPDWVVRLQSSLGLILGGFLLWSVSRRWTDA